MLVTTQPIAASHTPSHASSSLTSAVSSGRWTAAVPRRRQHSNTRRTVSKISCKRVSLVDAGTGEARVLTIEPPEKLKTTVVLKARVTDYDLSFFVETGEEKTTGQIEAKYVSNKDDFYTFEASIKVSGSFGTVGAVRLDNDHEREMFIKDVTVFPDGDESDAVSFHCESWVIDNEKNFNDDRRVFFPLKSYLPSQTPEGLKTLRQRELETIRGSGYGERLAIDRIYDYDVYNDLGDPKTTNLLRPVLGGSKELPYPRRCRTGRNKTKNVNGEFTEVRVSDNYVPRDEAFSEDKQQAFTTKFILAGLHALEVLKVLKDREASFPSMAAIDALFEDGFKNMPAPEEGGTVAGYIFSVIKDSVFDILKGDFAGMKHMLDKILDFETPEVHQSTLQIGIHFLTGFRALESEFPIVSQLDEETYGPRESLLTKQLIEEQINGVMTAEEVREIKEFCFFFHLKTYKIYCIVLTYWGNKTNQFFQNFSQAIKNKKLFMLDYHDALLPYVNLVRELSESRDNNVNTTLYGSRTLFFLTKDGTLKPIAIELTRPKNKKTGKLQWREVFTPGGSVTDSWLWQLAKTHVLAHDTGYHQLINHWLRTHCCVEPYIIAANRQLSQMHPIYRLLHPHFRYTMEINAQARVNLINAGGIIENNFSPNKYCLELSSVVYRDFWRFDMEDLPNDLIRRGMAVRGKDGKLELTIEDYPYANDGLLIWESIKEWASDYVNHYYPTAKDIVDDEELQGWWTEVRTKGHADKQDEPWWPTIDNHENLVQVLATIMWITSGHHAAVNFGQYPFAGYFPNRPTIARKNIPLEMGRQGMKELVENPEKVLLDTLPSQQQALLVLVTLNLLSSHSPDEEYLGTHVEPAWTAERGIRSAFDKFQVRMRDILDQIDEWNEDPRRRNRHGPGVVPYTLLRPCDGNPFDEKSEMEMGIPNSISI
ncbi:hypothetical protein PR202_ga14943 [Eleusine coracana subsp. coracana]|uniref:Lipoxygenase n=1 Tax=Eleusine coracana subsp. coracana TaxID=191504 RepID=A0AAV5CHT8_ELECO|nr:hypothetical protein PR202_ga14943 [Eleusine coracana subsp. coracana]